MLVTGEVCFYQVHKGWEGIIGSVVTIVCSDITRNGKTLLARLYADMLSLRKVNSPVIFDTDQSGNGIVNYFPDKTRSVDLTRIADQVALFDTMIELTSGGNGPDFVVDVSANELNRFFRVFSDIGFEHGAFEVQLDVQVCHIISWTLKSLKTAANIRDSLTTGRFNVVRNMAVEALPFVPEPEEEAQVPNIEIDLFLDELPPDIFRIINEKNFSFAKIIEGGYGELPYEIRAQILNFLEDVHNQISAF
jgi:hypothetical protein